MRDPVRRLRPATARLVGAEREQEPHRARLDPRDDQVVKIILSMRQVQELAAALDLPEGVYRLKKKGG